MCMATAYLKHRSGDELLLEEVASVRLQNDGVLLTTLFGRQECVAARIREIDFLESRIILERQEGRST
jgi:predicted RNA-binding protein